MPFLIGTAGHVDHGKTSLIQALTGIDADRLPEEKERGMTIDIGFAYIDLPKAGRVSIVDVPGHGRFVGNMLVGAMGMDIAVLCIDGNEGIMPQTLEHLAILELLPVQRLIVALTKADLIDTDLLTLQIQDVDARMRQTRFEEVPIVSVSSQTGEGIELLKLTLDRLMEAMKPVVDPNPAWYMPIDRSFLLKGIGLVITGYMSRGSVKASSEAEIQPGGKKVRIRNIHVHNSAVESSVRGYRTAMNISGADIDEVTRGMTIGQEQAVLETEICDFKIHWIDVPKHGMEVRVAIGSSDAFGKLFLNDNNPSLAQVRFSEPVGATKGQPVIIRRHSPPTILGGGVVVTAQAELRRKKELTRYIDLMNIEEGIIAAVHEDPNGVPTEEICRLMGVTQQQLGDHFENLIKERRLIGFAGLWYQPHIFLAQANILLNALKEIHQQNPQILNHPREIVLQKSGLKWSGKPYERILTKLAELQKIDVDGTRIKLREFKLMLNSKQEAFLQRVEDHLDTILINNPYPNEIASALGAPVQAIEEILVVAANGGKIAKVGETLYYTRNQVQKIGETLKAAFKDQPFTVSDAKEVLQTSRKFIIPVLEHLDSIGITQRLDDRRVIKL